MNVGIFGARSTLCAFVVAAMMFVAGPAKADQIFYFSFSGTNVSGTGTLNATPNGDGSFTAVSGTGVETVGGVSEAITLIFNNNGIFVDTSPSGILAYDNQLFPGSGPLLSDAGLLFSGATEANLFGIIGDGYGYFRLDGVSESITFALSDTPFETVPEPASIMLVGIAVLLCAASRRTHRRTKQ